MKLIKSSFVILTLFLIAIINEVHSQTNFNKFVGTWIEFSEGQGLKVLFIRKEDNNYFVTWKQVDTECYGFTDAKAVIIGDKLKCIGTLGVDNPSPVTWFITYNETTKKIKTNDPDAGQDTYYRKP